MLSPLIILYWYDIPTMLEIAHPSYMDHEEDDPHHDETTHAPHHDLVLPYATRVVEDHDDGTGGSSVTTWPIAPTADKVGDFKVSPSIHVGYAVTWYGLSTAGLYMTRLLMRKR